ncbi:formate dehydrogenase subunit delta [Maricaulis sp.]|uniref:formate dehydrogenase subunit delta n=1 Tax=Maricaulis sp. TaxID=1486257 RepID=UPI003A8FA27C|tara:strand:+ start:8044 stop:8259 length:216 start_codon:yes stop_codon:yes gene_type:complete
MNDASLIRMAHQIADFYAPYTEAEAIEGVAVHIRKFWDPGMRDRLIALSQSPDAGLRPTITAAITRLIALS